ncbi:hypothetical protein [Kribbella sp. NPDC051770]|uniref:hypothetical protein n=1 Tax=Kribbella sp. NPDC051770 TaxID=3155413 RepID=UPI003449F3E0
MKRLQRALDAGWDPDRLTSQYNAAALDKRAAEAAMAAIQPAQRLTVGDVTKMIAELGDMARVLNSAGRGDLAELYKALGLAITLRRQSNGLMSPSARVWPRSASEGEHAP